MSIVGINHFMVQIQQKQKNNELKFNWPAQRLPVIIRAKRFNFYSHNFDTTFFTKDYHAIHFYLYEGKMRFNDQEMDIHPGDITVSPTGITTSYHTAEMSSHLCIHFDARYADDLDSQEQLGLPLYYSLGKQASEAREKFLEIIEFHNLANSTPVVQYAAASALRQLILWLYLGGTGENNFHNAMSSAERRLNTVIEIIEDSFENPITVSELIKKVGISQNYMAQIFRQKYGMTIQRYILTRRIENAKFMLKNTNMQIKEIGTVSGLSNPQYFNKRFREINGMSPSEYRKNYQV